MTTGQFNEKYKDYLEEGHYGLAFGDEEFINWLDSKFQEFIKKPGFTYSQIKVKFGTNCEKEWSVTLAMNLKSGMDEREFRSYF